MIRRPPRSTLSSSSAASDVYKRQIQEYAKGFVDGMQQIIENDLPFIVIVENDMAKVLGQAIYALSLIHISEPTRQAEISYAVFCLKKKKP
ncbi:reactivating factor for ethanolamine ammonia lyase [Clostridioides difficile]|nr:reactivating factor for ethanolamine ammonia lyase [Clostridioides difficile]